MLVIFCQLFVMYIMIYHAIYIFIHIYIYIVCILIIIYNIILISNIYVYIYYVRIYFLIASKLDFQLMIYHLPVPGGGGISEGSAEKLSLGTRDLSVDLLGMTVFAGFWDMPF